jgi:hypothetical protein
MYRPIVSGALFLESMQEQAMSFPVSSLRKGPYRHLDEHARDPTTPWTTKSNPKYSAHAVSFHATLVRGLDLAATWGNIGCPIRNGLGFRRCSQCLSCHRCLAHNHKIIKYRNGYDVAISIATNSMMVEMRSVCAFVLL